MAGPAGKLRIVRGPHEIGGSWIHLVVPQLRTPGSIHGAVSAVTYKTVTNPPIKPQHPRPNILQ